MLMCLTSFDNFTANVGLLFGHSVIDSIYIMHHYVSAYYCTMYVHVTKFICVCLALLVSCRLRLNTNSIVCHC